MANRAESNLIYLTMGVVFQYLEYEIKFVSLFCFIKFA